MTATGTPVTPATPAKAAGYDRADWASAFCNVGVELEGVPVTASRGASGCITPLMATA